MTDLLRIPVNRALSERVRWMITLRWLVLMLAAGLILAANRWLGGVLPTGPIWGTVAALAVINGALWIIVHRLVSPEGPYHVHAWLLHMQIIVDLVALTVLLHFSGGLENPLATYYVLLVAMSSLLVTPRASIFYAVCASVLWVGLLVGEATGLLPHYNLVGFRLPARYHEVGHVISESLVLVTANLGVSLLAASITTRLREGESQLYEANASCELRADELARLNERLRELDRSRLLFTRMVTHELRAPIAAIQSYLRLILDGYVPPERTLEIVGKAEQRARDQIELIGDLLDLAHLGDPKAEKQPGPCDAGATLMDVLDLLQPRAQAKRLRVHCEVAPALPPAALHCDHVRQVWLNLVANAIQYTPEGGEIIASLCQEGDWLAGSVRDTGIGIAPEEQGRVWDEFYRTEAAKAMSRQGTGLGLAIFRRAVERYGGEVELVSAVGEGSTFRFTLPVWEG